MTFKTFTSGLVLTFFLGGLGGLSAQATRTLTNLDGSPLVVPTSLHRIADAWHAHNVVLAMLGAGDRIVGTVFEPTDRPWFYRIQPSMKGAAPVFKTALNTEELVKLAPDLVFLPASDKNADKIRSLGIPVVPLNFTDFAGLKACFVLTGEILGGTAPQRAAKYTSYLDAKLALVTGRTGNLPADKRPKVLHLTSVTPLLADGNNTIIQAWIEAAGGVNAAAGVSGLTKEINMEQVLAWDPDVIIVSQTVGSKSIDEAALVNDPLWKKLKAVQNGKLVRNPDGAFLWDRNSAEEALQIQWAAQLLHPDLFPELDMVKEAQGFYQDFFGYSLTVAEAQKILAAKLP